MSSADCPQQRRNRLVNVLRRVEGLVDLARLARLRVSRSTSYTTAASAILARNISAFDENFIVSREPCAALDGGETLLRVRIDSPPPASLSHCPTRTFERKVLTLGGAARILLEPDKPVERTLTSYGRHFSAARNGSPVSKYKPDEWFEICFAW